MNYEYVFEGTLEKDDPTYVEREADRKLYEGLKKGKFCYIFNSRKVGKSSLRVQVMHRLQAESTACSVIDLSKGGSQQTEIQWYAGMLKMLIKDLDLEIDLGTWWREHEWLSPLARFTEFIESILLVQLSENVVIFIDEIDYVLSLKFPTDDFFAFIRACHEERVNHSEYKRLTFCLLGVATPSNLIQDRQRTPFNIGRAIELTGFTLEEAQKPLGQGLAAVVDQPEAILQSILSWTGGQPFLTQKLCYLVAQTAEQTGNRQPNLNQVVQKFIIDNWESQDEPEHLRTIRDRLLRDEQWTKLLLELYQQILNSEAVMADSSLEKAELQLSGVVIQQNNQLKVYNPIYEAVFNEKWLENQLSQLRPFGDLMGAWFNSGGQDVACLLRQQQLREAWDCIERNGRRLSLQEHKFLTASEEANSMVKKLQGQVNNPWAVIHGIYLWTGGQQELKDLLFSVVLTSNELSSEVSEAKWVEEIVESRILTPWRENREVEPLQRIENRLTQLPDNERFWSLILYRQLLSHGELDGNYNKVEQKKLQEIGLIVDLKAQKKIKIANRIYGSVFDLPWVEQQLSQLRPYGIQLGAWLTSNLQDISYLLCGQDLHNALTWSDNHPLQEQEHLFLACSQAWNV